MLDLGKNNTTTIRHVLEQLESDEDIFNGLLFAFSLLAIMSCFLGIVAMQRTNRIPYAPKLLSQVLLSLDIILLATSCVRRFLRDPTINVQFNVFGMLCHLTAMVTITILSIERLFIFVWPNTYMRVVSSSKLRAIITVTWVTFACIFYFMRFFVCSRLIDDPSMVFYVPWICNKLMLLYDIVIVVTCYVINVVCYVIICRLISNKDHRCQQFTMKIFSYKATSFVLITFVMILLNSIFYLSLMVIVQRRNISVADTRLMLDCMRLINCFVDTCLYALWFTESRIEILKMFSPLNQRLLHKADEMKFNAFNIVVYRKHGNRIYPMTDLNDDITLPKYEKSKF